MKIKILILSLSFLIFSAGCSKDNPVTVIPGANSGKLQEMVDSLTSYFHTQRNIQNGGFYVKVNTFPGEYLVSSGITPGVTNNSHFRVASITKTFTAASIMLLYQQGKINIYDLITDNIPGTNTPYVPNSPEYNVPFKNQITIELLLQHRAGVFDVTNSPIPDTVMQPYAGYIYPVFVMDLPGNQYHTFTFDELVGVAALNHLCYFPPGEAFHYSNTGYNILGKIIERVSGLSYSNFLKYNFFQPLQLSNTTSVWNGTDIDIPVPYMESFLNENGAAINTTRDNMSSNVAEGNIISTPADITRWIRLLLTGQAGVNMSSVEKMETMLPADPVHGVYGLGLTYNQMLGYGHNGAHASYLTILRYNPENGMTILVGANFWDIADIYGQAEKMTDFALSVVKIFN